MTLEPGASDVPVLLIQSEGPNWLEVRAVDEDTPGFLPVLGPIADAAREVLSTEPGRKLGARMFVCHPDDLRLLDGAARRFVDDNGYARAFAHDASGDFLVNARFKEVSLPPLAAPDPISVALLAAQLQTQMMLEQIHAQVKDIRRAVDYLARVDSLDLEAEVLGRATFVDDVWRALQESGTVNQTDWDEIQHLGPDLADQHRKVLGRLRIVHETLMFTTPEGARQARQVPLEKVANLFQVERYVYRALCQHLDVAMTVRAQRGEKNANAVHRAARIKADHLRESQTERDAFAAIAPMAKPELGGIIAAGVFSYVKQELVIRAGHNHVRSIVATVPTTLTSEMPTRRMIEADSSHGGSLGATPLHPGNSVDP